MQKLEEFKSLVISAIEQIAPGRKSALQQIAAFVEHGIETSEKADLIFICTHNSRRSVFSQVWAQIAAFHFGFRNIRCYSGGTEATAIYRTVIQTLRNQGLQVEAISKIENSIYSFKYHPNEPAIIGFSKVYDDLFNVQTNFAAIMTCSQADENCPFIPSAAMRFSLPFEDPKDFDATSQEETIYAQRSLEIASEMFYLFQLIQK
ncbi:MAG: protein-tyrosine-phosphatase [Cryomorphaceae bacterium]|nr:protein-tyrosine-phosphatase [Cryomorphaceae bacterium]